MSFGAALADSFPVLRRELGGDDDPWSFGNATLAITAYEWVTIVDEVILALTIAGALAILGSMFYMEYKGRPATTRMRLVQSLVLSDLIVGLVGIVGTSIVLTDTPLQTGTSTCSGLGFSLVAVLWTEHMWTLILAIATYMILIYPLHPATMWLERRWYWLWLLVWVIAVVVAIIGIEVFGYFPNGGICYYGANSGLYGELIQFIPRAFVMIVISVLYARLFVFLRRPDRIRASFSNSDNSELYGVEPKGILANSSRAVTSFIKRRKTSKGTSGTGEKTAHKEYSNGDEQKSRPQMNFALPHRSADFSYNPQEDGQMSPGSRHDAQDYIDLQAAARGIGEATNNRRLSTPPPTPEERAPWDDVQLPIFHIGGEKFGGSSSTHLHRQTSSSMWSAWRGLGGNKDRHGRPHRASAASSTSPPMATSTRFSSNTSRGEIPASPPNQFNNFPPTLEVDSPDEPEVISEDYGYAKSRYNTDKPNGEPVGWMPSARLHERQNSVSSLGARVQQLRKASAVSAVSSSSPLSEEPLTMSRSGSSTRIASQSTNESDPTRYASTTENGEGESDGHSDRKIRGGNRVSFEDSDEDAEARNSDLDDNRAEDNGGVGGVDPSSGLRLKMTGEKPRMIRSSSNTQLQSGMQEENGGQMTSRGDAFDVEAGGGGEDGLEDEDDWDLMRMLQATAAPPKQANGDDGRHEETVEFVEESMASYLNRKTALLMLWFPLGYIMLFSVSLIRIIFDFAGSPPIELRALSRWFIFSQGILDAFIYGLVEWHTKKVVRKRVRKGTFNTPAVTPYQSGIMHNIRSFGHIGRSSKNHQSSTRGMGVNSTMSMGERSRPGFSSQIGSMTGSFMGGASTPGLPAASPTTPSVEPRSILQELRPPVSPRLCDMKETEEGVDGEKGSHGVNGDEDARARERRKE